LEHPKIQMQNGRIFAIRGIRCIFAPQDTEYCDTAPQDTGYWDTGTCMKMFFEKDVKTVATKRCEKTGDKSLFSISLIAEHVRSLQTLPSLHPSPPGSKEHLRRLLSELTEWHRAYLSASDYRTTHSTADNRDCGRKGRSHFVELY
jgi:hypothetical protein